MSRISRVEVHEFTYTAADVGLDAGRFDLVYQPGGRMPVSKYAIVIETADGSRGEYVGLWGATRMALGQTLTLAAQLPGRDALQRELIYDEFKRALRQYDHMGHGMIDICLWDLAGKRLGASVSTLLGGWRRRLPTYASTAHGDHAGGLDSPEAYVAFAEACLGLGYRAFKMHGWYEGDVAREVATIKALGRAVGDRMTLMLDPACQLRTFADALAVGRACDEANFFWYEDPFRDTGVSCKAHQLLRERLRTPLLATEHVRGVEPKIDFAIAGGTDFLRADPEYDMGITGVMKIAHAAEALGLDVEIHASGPAHRHCMAAIRNTNFYELALVGPRMANPLPRVYACGYSDELEAVGADGCFPVPDGPGLGVLYDWEFIARHRTALHEFRL
ncbi:MAG TPA: enolase C-terminal domain-like protein [Azospirillaceae bacterium]|nr:enolase C-terminal domain-like protein [Azospirillaceae bacterium]